MKRILIIALAAMLVIMGSTFAYTFTTATGTIGIAEPTGDIATCNATATQPGWGSILTPVADTEFLRPSMAGDETLITNQSPSSGEHWDKVTEEAADDDITTVYTSSSSWREDLYNITNHSSGAGTIIYVTVYMVCRASTANVTQTSAYIHIKTNGVEYNGSEETLTDSYTAYWHQWDTNPQTSDNWTWDEIDALQIGVGLRQPNSDEQTLCTQVYAEVGFEAPPLCGDVPTGDLFRVAPNPAYGGDLKVAVSLVNTGALIKAYEHLNTRLYMNGSVEAQESPNYQLLTLQNGVATFTIEDIGAVSDNWTQTSQADFEGGTSYQVDTSTSPGDVILDTFSDTVTDTFNDETKIASKSNLIVTGGQVKLTTTSGTETLRPNAAGDETGIASRYPASGGHWDKVDEAVSDDDGTYVYTSAFSYEEDLFNLPSHTTGQGVINSVTVYVVCRSSASPYQASAYVHMKTNGVEDNGSPVTVTSSYATYSNPWVTNPQTGNAWTWAEIDALQIGVGLREPRSGTSYTTRCTQVYAEVSYTYYNSPGTLTSVNLLSGEVVKSIDSFDYNASAIPSGTGLKVQFSQDNTNWYNSSGNVSDWDTMSQGINNIDLSGLGWSGSNFYYKMEFTSDGNDTPVLDEITVNFSTYYASGTLTSSAHDAGYEDHWDWGTISFTINEPSGTDIKFQIRTAATEGGLSSANWTGPTGTGDYYTTSGTAINSVHDGDRWIQYKAYYSGPGSATPTLSDVSITYYSESVIYTIEVIGGGYCLNSREPSEWEEGWTVSPELYCEVTQR